MGMYLHPQLPRVYGLNFNFQLHLCSSLSAGTGSQGKSTKARKAQFTWWLSNKNVRFQQEGPSPVISWFINDLNIEYYRHINIYKPYIHINPTLWYEATYLSLGLFRDFPVDRQAGVNMDISTTSLKSRAQMAIQQREEKASPDSIRFHCGDGTEWGQKSYKLMENRQSTGKNLVMLFSKFTINVLVFSVIFLRHDHRGGSSTIFTCEVPSRRLESPDRQAPPLPPLLQVMLPQPGATPAVVVVAYPQDLKGSWPWKIHENPWRSSWCWNIGFPACHVGWFTTARPENANTTVRTSSEEQWEMMC